MVTSAYGSNRPARPICHCLGVTEGEIRQAIAEGELGSVRQVAHACGAGGGCTACHRHIKRYLHEAAQSHPADMCYPEAVEQRVLGFT
jgi:bacterioferritin-associated ferredoxin